MLGTNQYLRLDGLPQQLHVTYGPENQRCVVPLWIHAALHSPVLHPPRWL